MNAIAKLKKTIENAEKKLEKIQSECSHPKTCVTSKYQQATDEYGTTVTAEWYSNECSLCEARWTTDEKWTGK